jgi:hypothetical protein
VAHEAHRHVAFDPRGGALHKPAAQQLERFLENVNARQQGEKNHGHAHQLGRGASGQLHDLGRELSEQNRESRLELRDHRHR